MSLPYFAPRPDSVAKTTEEFEGKRGRFAPYSEPETPKIGKNDHPVRALAFSGGLFDTAMQLGVAHALIVSRAEPPDVAVGVSTGAINAVTLAEILQAGSDARTEQEQVEAQVARFRQVLESYRESRDELATALGPDAYQVDAQRPLEPTRLPIHAEEERKSRRRAADARAGLISLANDILQLDVSVSTLTRAVHAALALRAAGDQPSWWKRLLGRTQAVFRLWWLALWNFRKFSVVGSRLLGAYLLPVSRWFERVDSAMASLPRSVGFRAICEKTVIKRLRLSSLIELVGGAIGFIGEVRSQRGTSAGGVLFRSRWLRRHLKSAVVRVLGFLFLSPVALILPGIVLGALVWAGDTISHLAAFGALHSLWSMIAPVTVDSFVHERLSKVLSRRAWLISSVGATLWCAAYGVWLAIVVRRIGVNGILALYRIDDGLLDPHAVRSWFVRLLDPYYYGRVSMSDVVESAITGAPPRQRRRAPRALAEYDRGSPPIHARPMAANVQTSKLEVLDNGVPVVDALLAATAFPPFFQAQWCGDAWYIDGAVVANEPIRALITHLTPRVNDDSTCVDVYTVSSLPLNARELGGDRASYSGAIDIAKRARQLESFRDATLDRRMTMLVSRMLPGDRATWWAGRDEGEPDTNKKKYLRANVYPVELEALGSVNDKLLAAATIDERREVIAQAVADGCRSSLETMLHQSLSDAGGSTVPCRQVLGIRLGKRGFVPGSGATPDGPGLPEVCQACALRRQGVGVEARQALRVPTVRHRDLPLWPVIGDPAPPRKDAEGRNVADDERRGIERSRRQAWPVSRDRFGPTAQSDPDRPTISLLFSGGVFRGVYLAGIVNALNELTVKPDLIAGSSIGSITAAMAARVFAEPDREGRQRRIVDVAATYMAVDRLVLTDRFSDFVRNFTLRAGATTFSLKELDTAFRVFDRPGTSAFGRDIRRVLAGLERLFYVSPFEARDVVKAFRLRRYGEAQRLIELYLQEWLERGAVGLEILGAEPLSILIREHVLEGTAGRAADPAAGFVEILAERGIQFIATMTNLTRGRLDVVHLPAIAEDGEGVRAIEALLASSAFPAVFRPRWSWEVDPEATAVEQYIDGGVMDNLPLDAVANFLNEARYQHRLNPRPMVAGNAVPHLLFTGSLEISPEKLTDDGAAAISRYWMRTRRRATQLKYNTKIDNYARSQRALRRIYNAAPAAARYVPLDLEVVAVKPNWLCETFAFHPMLGFRRKEQARSIAHGCKTTLAKFNKLREQHASWLNAWGVQPPQGWSDAPVTRGKAPGECWYRRDCLCPFSERGLSAADGERPIKPETRRVLTTIYRECGKTEIHSAQA
jgi:predicted acylesterase/phospholipase RssA